jgi:two-component system chemotaxis response regulator CheB
MRRVLIGEDSAVIRSFFKRALKKFDLEVEFVTEFKKFLDMFDKDDHYLYILDIGLIKTPLPSSFFEIVSLKKKRFIILSSIEIEIEEKYKNIFFLKKPKRAIDFRRAESKLSNILQNICKKSGNQKFVLVGASTGGPSLIESIARNIPAKFSSTICIVQHLPDSFTKNFARRLNHISNIDVTEAKEGLRLYKGQMIIAKGGKHLYFGKDSDGIYVRLIPNFNKRVFVPSVDEMFISASKIINPSNIMAVLLTGIGDDGAEGILKLKKAGAYTVAQSEESSVVYGMPKEAFLRGGIQKVLDFDEIVEEIIKFGK